MERGREERPEWGASPAKPCGLSVLSRCSSLLGVKRQRGVPEFPSGAWATFLFIHLRYSARHFVFLPALKRTQSFRDARLEHADVCTIGALRPGADSGQDEVTGAGRLPGEAWRVRARLHADAEEAELCFAQSGESALDEQRGSDHVYSRHRP